MRLPTPDELLPWIVLLPAMGALWNGILSPVIGRVLGYERSHSGVGFVACATVFAAFGLSVLAVAKLAMMPAEARHATYHAWEWFTLRLPPPFGSADDIRVPVEVALRLDALSGTMLLVVTGVGSLIHLYSTGYMHDDPSPGRYFAYLNLFMFAMLVLILGESLPVMFIGWEGVGLASYLLIGFWFDKDENARAGQKAFVVNRIGDLAFLLGIFLLASQMGTVSFPGMEQLLARAPDTLNNVAFELGGSSPKIVTIAAILLFIGACGKSAQIPLHVWLPDAMAGPTPVSALIHAATMVTAGVYMVARMHFVFVLSGTALAVVATTGAVTALFAASIALTQNDIKKVLAYSTVSQLGYMFAAVGVGAYVTGVFHLVTHAFFKACLFLGAGSVIHAMSGEQDIRKMGGLRAKMRTTHWTFLAATLAISGFPFTAGFFSKDAILWAVFAREPGRFAGLNLFLYVTLLLGAACTAFYMFRLYFLVFAGGSRADHHVQEHTPSGGLRQPVHESPWTMTAPLMVLGVLSIVAGFANAEALHGAVPLWFEHWLAPGVEEGVPHIQIGGGRASLELGFVGVSVVVALASILYARSWYDKGPSERADALAKGAPGLYRLVLDKWRVDELYDRTIVRGLEWLGRIGAEIVDPGLIDRVMVHGTAGLARLLGRLLRLLQTGRIQVYAMVMAASLAGILFKLTIPESDFDRAVDGRRVTLEALKGPGYEYRWDFDGDRRWDTEWGADPHVQHRFAKNGRYTVRLEVRSPLGSATAEHGVHVRGKAPRDRGKAPRDRGEARKKAGGSE
jgi:NADH-quinone oxidoreductase subunit L